MLEHGLEDLRVVVRAPEQVAEDALAHRDRRVLDEVLRVHDAPRAKAVTVRTGAIRRVEAEVAGLEIIDGVAVLGACERERVLQQLALRAFGLVTAGQQVEAHAAGGELRRLLHALRDAAERVLADDDAVDHDLDGVLVLLVELDVLIQLADLAVDAHAAEALVAQVLEQLLVLALAAKHDRREHVRAPALTRLEHLVRDLVRRLAADGPTALRAVRDADARIQKTQVVVYLRHRAHRGARVAARRLLVD